MQCSVLCCAVGTGHQCSLVCLYVVAMYTAVVLEHPADLSRAQESSGIRSMEFTNEMITNNAIRRVVSIVQLGHISGAACNSSPHFRFCLC